MTDCLMVPGRRRSRPRLRGPRSGLVFLFPAQQLGFFFYSRYLHGLRSPRTKCRFGTTSTFPVSCKERLTSPLPTHSHNPLRLCIIARMCRQPMAFTVTELYRGGPTLSLTTITSPELSDILPDRGQLFLPFQLLIAALDPAPNITAAGLRRGDHSRLCCKSRSCHESSPSSLG